ncbi:protein TASOR isoform X1 [Gadus morhua]|nr:protein TASOR-like isoform X1 [Gadus morhua]
MEDARSGRRNPSAAGSNVSNRSAADSQDGGLSPSCGSPTASDHRGSEVIDLLSCPETKLSERKSSASNPVHLRHMPMEPLKFHIPRKNKETRALFQYVSSESREFEDMLTILTSSYKDSSSSLCFTYSKPRLVHNAVLEGQFVEKRKEMKSEGRTENELEESYCFLLADAVKLPWMCEKGLLTGHSWVTALGNPSKGVYLSKFSDLLQNNSFSPGSSGEILIFKVMKGKVKSIYESMSKNLLDPTPRFDSHVSKNASKVTSLTSYRAFELTQQYFYEYWFDEVRPQPRQVCPYAVVSYSFKGKDTPLPSKPLPPPRLNSQSAGGSKERAQFVVWSGALVKGEQHLLHLSLLSFSPPLLPCSLPEKLEIDWLMSLNRVTEHLPASLFCWNLYTGSHEVVKSGWFCSLLEVSERRGSGPDASKLLLQLEERKLVLLCPLPDSGFLILLSSVQMAAPPERPALWKRCLQALFVFPESRDMARPRGCPSSYDATGLVPRGVELGQFVPALHHALVKARANPPTELAAGVERQAGLYLAGRRDRTVRAYPTPVYDSKLDDRGKLFPAPKHHRLNMEGYLRSYLYSPVFYQLPLGHANRLLELHPPPDEEEPEGAEPLTEPGAEPVPEHTIPLKVFKRSSVRDPRTAGARDEEAPQGRKRSLEELTDPSLKRIYQGEEPGACLTADSSPKPAPGCSLSSVIGSGVLKDVDLRRDGPEAANNLLNILSGLNQHSEAAIQSGAEEEARDRLAGRLGLPDSGDLDLRKHQELEVQTGGSVSSMEGFSPGSHTGELTPQAAAQEEEEKERRGGGDKEHLIPWVLIPITGVCCDKYSQQQVHTPRDPRLSQTARDPSNSTGAPSTVPPSSPELSIPTSPPPSTPPGPFTTCPFNELQTGSVEVQLPPPAPWQPAGVASQNMDTTPFFAETTQTPSPYNSPQHKEVVEQREEMALLEEEVKEEEEEEEVRMESSKHEREEPRAPAVASPSPAPLLLEDVDGIVMENLGVFSLGIQHLLQEVNITCSARPHTLRTHPRHRTVSTEHKPSTARTHSVEHSPSTAFARSVERTPSTEPTPPAAPSRRLAGFSQYVSLFSTSTPIQEFVCSLRNDMSSLLQDTQATGTDSLANSSLAEDSRTETNVTLASSISDFLAGMRASANDGSGSICSSSEPLGHNVMSSGKEVESGRSGSGFSTPLLQPLTEHPPPCEAPPQPLLGPTQPSWCPQQPPGLLGNSSSTIGSSLVDADGEGSLSVLRDRPCPDPVPEPDPIPDPDSGLGLCQAPPPGAISSLISQLQPEVFSNLVEIIKDVKRNSVQFYVHNSEPEDLLYDQIREYLLSQGHVEQSPVTFLEQEGPGERFLVVIQNKDISAHIHKVPGLVSLKRRDCVQFVGVDSLDDLRNGSYNELFVSGGCIVSDEFVLNPHFITHERLDALLMFLEEQSSAEGVWRWRIHCKTHKNLKQQARFKKDAASLLDVLSAYQKRLMVELLPYHHCDMTKSQSPDLECLIELQARYTQHRHLIFLTERRFEMFPKYSSSGIIIANMDDVVHNFNSLVVDQGHKDKPITEDLPEGVGPGLLNRHLIQEDPALVSELSPSHFPKLPVAPISCPHFLPLSSPTNLPATLLDQLVPDSRKSHSTSTSSSCSSANEGLPPQTNADFEALRFAISHFKAERQARAQKLQQHGREGVANGCPTPPSGPPEEIQLTPGRKALEATLDSIHSVLAADGGGAAEPGGSAMRGAHPTVGGVHGGASQPVGGKVTVHSEISVKAEPSAITTVGTKLKTANECEEGVCSRGLVDAEPICSTLPMPIETCTPRQQGGPEPSSGQEEAPQASKMTGFITTLGQDPPGPARTPVHPFYQFPQQPRFPQPRFHSALLPQPPAAMRYPHNPMLGPLAALGGMRHLLGPGVVWPGGLLWNFQQAGREMNLPSLMGNFPNPGVPGANQYRPGPRGGR